MSNQPGSNPSGPSFEAVPEHIFVQPSTGSVRYSSPKSSPAAPFIREKPKPQPQSSPKLPKGPKVVPHNPESVPKPKPILKKDPKPVQPKQQDKPKPKPQQEPRLKQEPEQTMASSSRRGLPAENVPKVKKIDSPSELKKLLTRTSGAGRYGEHVFLFIYIATILYLCIEVINHVRCCNRHDIPESSPKHPWPLQVFWGIVQYHRC